MQALFFGLVAALAWGFHDLSVRFIAQRTSVLSAILTVLMIGAILVGVVAAMWGDWQSMTPAAFSFSGLSGIAYAAGSYGLYRALGIGPVKLVAPIIGAFPIISVAFAMIAGQIITGQQWAATIVVVVGVAFVSIFSADEEDNASRVAPIMWSIISAFGFALTFALGQKATQVGADLPVLVATRAAAIACICIMLLVAQERPWPPMRSLPLLALMGLLDAVALGFVLSSGSLPRPEYASVSASLFGVITIILARMILKEYVTRLQWASIGVTFSGIAWLGLL